MSLNRLLWRNLGARDLLERVYSGVLVAWPFLAWVGLIANGWLVNFRAIGENRDPLIFYFIFLSAVVASAALFAEGRTRRVPPFVVLGLIGVGLWGLMGVIALVSPALECPRLIADAVQQARSGL
jgi:hypothetical protein